ncbi:hypothetical protein Hanom_Chr04g00335621 [Helianthus anomalus]
MWYWDPQSIRLTIRAFFFGWSSWRSMKVLIFSKCLHCPLTWRPMKGLFDFSKVVDQLDPITALVFSWQKIEFELCPALLGEVKARFDTDVCQVSAGFNDIRINQLFECPFKITSM